MRNPHEAARKEHDLIEGITRTQLLGQLFWLLSLAGLCGRGMAAEDRAEPGFGTLTRGGDDHPVVEVTSLDDSGPGTLRAAASGGQRRIVFRVGGVIRLQKPLPVVGPAVTIDGREAPQPGITIAGKTLIIADTQDVILRHLRVRDSDDDNIRLVGRCSNVVIDHCSSTDAGDGAIDITENYKTGESPRDVTVSWCLIAGTDKAMLVSAASNISFHHNLFTNNGQRQPQLHNVNGFDFRNNVVRYWTVYGLRARAGSTGNIVNNVFGSRSNLKKRPDTALILLREPVGTVTPAGKIFVRGNVARDGFDPNGLGDTDRPLPAPRIDTLNVSQVEAAVLQDVGARPLDERDRQLVQGQPDRRPRPATTD